MEGIWACWQRDSWSLGAVCDDASRHRPVVQPLNVWLCKDTGQPSSGTGQCVDH